LALDVYAIGRGQRKRGLLSENVAAAVDRPRRVVCPHWADSFRPAAWDGPAAAAAAGSTRVRKSAKHKGMNKKEALRLKVQLNSVAAVRKRIGPEHFIEWLVTPPPAKNHRPMSPGMLLLAGQWPMAADMAKEEATR